MHSREPLGPLSGSSLGLLAALPQARGALRRSSWGFSGLFFGALGVVWGALVKITRNRLKKQLILIDFDPKNEAWEAQFPTSVFARRSTFDSHGFRHHFDGVRAGFPKQGFHCVSVASVVEAKARLHENHCKTQGSGVNSQVLSASAPSDLVFRKKTKRITDASIRAASLAMISNMF